MTKTFNYADAANLLGGRDSKILRAIDRLMGGALFASAAAGFPFALSLFEAKNEMVRLSSELVSHLGEKLKGLGAIDRTERLAAAHAVIVVTAYFEALDKVKLPFDTKELKFQKHEQAQLATSETIGTNHLGSLAQELLAAALPVPLPQQPYEATLEILLRYYEKVSARAISFISGLAIWDMLDDTSKTHVTATISKQVPEAALAAYEHLFRRLAVQFPEVAFWEDRVDHQATREGLRQLRTSIDGLERILAAIKAGVISDERLASLAQRNRAVLDLPILEAKELSAGDLCVPSLGNSYVNPDFRVADAHVSDRPDLDVWWAEHPIRSDLQGFLLGHLTSKQAVRAPLMILGQPGSGKSLLTKILAARLPADGFLSVRVVLRDVPIEDDLQRQIEYAIRDATGDDISWPSLVRSAPDALPVVLLDGFDELLQTTGVSQSDYLDKISRFQEREASVGRPVAVAVTSRTAVADRARIPVGGMVALRMEPFNKDQVTTWLEIWNKKNSSYFAAHGIRALAPKVVLNHRELAVQPLLLLMLALYDADDNALQNIDAKLGQTELYDRLLTSFTEREVRKIQPPLEGVRFEEELDRQLLRLSIAACAMFNRSRLWVTEAELDHDIATLMLNERGQVEQAGTFRAPLSAAQITFGQFFFIHQPQATRSESRVTGSEFLHATFGEFLIARIVSHELDNLVRVAEITAGNIRRPELDDGFLHAILSFAPLAVRTTILSFLHELLQGMATARRKMLQELLVSIFNDALSSRLESPYDSYTPYGTVMTERCAVYSVNVLLLIVLLRDKISVRELFSGNQTPTYLWRRQAEFWRSQLSPEGWASVMDALSVRRIRHEEIPGIEITRSKATSDELNYSDYKRELANFASFNLVLNRPAGTAGSSELVWTGQYDFWLKQAAFLCDPEQDIVAHALHGLGELASGTGTFMDGPGPRCVSMTHALIRLWLVASAEEPGEDLTDVYDDCITPAMHPSSAFSEDFITRYREVILRQISIDFRRLPGAWREELRGKLERAWGSSERTDPDLAGWAFRMIIKLGFEPKYRLP